MPPRSAPSGGGAAARACRRERMRSSSRPIIQAGPGGNSRARRSVFSPNAKSKSSGPRALDVRPCTGSGRRRELASRRHRRLPRTPGRITPSQPRQRGMRRTWPSRRSAAQHKLVYYEIGGETCNDCRRMGRCTRPSTSRRSSSDGARPGEARVGRRRSSASYAITETPAVLITNPEGRLVFSCRGSRTRTSSIGMRTRTSTPTASSLSRSTPRQDALGERRTRPAVPSMRASTSTARPSGSSARPTRRHKPEMRERVLGLAAASSSSST